MKLSLEDCKSSYIGAFGTINPVAWSLLGKTKLAKGQEGEDFSKIFSTQWAFTYSKSTVETLEQGRKYVKVNNKDTKTYSLTLSQCLCC